jgi:nucleotide-binding universal stress UspA family protein
MNKWNIQKNVKILVPIDETQEAEKAASYATGIASTYSGTINLINIVPSRGLPQILDYVPEFVKETMDSVEKAGVKCNANVFRGSPGRTIVQQAEKNDFDLIVMANKSYSGLGIFKLNDASDYVVDKANVPVLVIK